MCGIPFVLNCIVIKVVAEVDTTSLRSVASHTTSLLGTATPLLSLGGALTMMAFTEWHEIGWSETE